MKKPLVVILTALLLAALFVPGRGLAQVEKKTQSVDLTADLGTFNWATNIHEFSGHVHAVLTGAYAATVDAPKMTFKLTPKGNQVDDLVAYGPVRFVIITQPNASGVQYKVVATATDRATYSESNQTLVLKGNADATITSLPESPDAQTAHFTGDEIDADLANSLMTVTQAHMQVSSPLKEAVPAPAAH
jgi:lipopolysaccharide export system protein LptA